MAKRIGISMRMTRMSSTGEVRDCLSTDWYRFMASALPHAALLPVPNMGESVAGWAEGLDLEGVILTGGDDWNVFPERDATETALVNWARGKRIPLLGVCRGMQVINHVLGGALPSVRCGEEGMANHVAARHPVWKDDVEILVNSYHDNILRKQDIAPLLTVCELGEDGSVEGVVGQEGRIRAIMWHPEREDVATDNDKKIFRKLFG